MTKLKPLLIGLVGAGVLAASGYSLYAIGMQRGMGMAAPPASSLGASAAPASTAPGAVPQSVAEGDVTFHHIESNPFSAFRSHPVFGIYEPVRFRHLQAS